MAKHNIPILEKEEHIPETSIYICENTDCIFDPLEQMTYALNETQVSYGSIIVLKNAP
jgi:hypothetical protein